MNTPQATKWKITASLICMALLMLAGSAPAMLVTATDSQQGSTTVFSPSWAPDAANSLINGLAPSSTVGNFDQENNWGDRNVTNLTYSRSGWLDVAAGHNTGNDTTTNNYVAVGQNGGNSLVYTLPSTTYGYNITNIAAFGGWADGGRDALRFNVSYCTVSDTNTFIPLTYVNYNPSVSGKRSNRVIFSDSNNSFIAPNVAMVKFDFTSPSAENGWEGLAAITIGGTAATGLTNLPLAITYSNSTSPWTIEGDSLIAGQVPATAAGNFAQESATGTPALTDGAFTSVTGVGSYATCGNNAGQIAVFSVTNSANGSDITNIIVYSGWGDAGRDGQFYNISYSTPAAPVTFIPLASIFYNPAAGTPSANRVAIHRADGGPLAVNVANIKFDFTPQTGEVDNGYSGYAEIILEGTNSSPLSVAPSPYLISDTLPGTASDVIGGSVSFSAIYSNSPAATYQWQVISGGITNDIAGETNTTLTLNNLQLANTGSYRLKAINATNSTGIAYTTASPLTVSSVPSPVNNIITATASQTGLGINGVSTNFYPTWIVPTNSLLHGFVIGSPDVPGQFVPGSGNYGLANANSDPTILTDGANGWYSFWPGFDSSVNQNTCGIGGGGTSLTYTIDTSSAANGFDITNIVVFGGWGVNTHDQQKYRILFSTVDAPTSFQSMELVDYTPVTPNGVQSATRVTLAPAPGVAALARHVKEVKFDFNQLQPPTPKGGYEGYSEIIVAGRPTPPIPTITTNAAPFVASDVVGGQISIYAGLTGATSLQWQKNGTNIPGATTAVLTLNNLQLTNTGNYRLVGSNSFGTETTLACALTVNPLPAPVSNVITAIATQTKTGGSFGGTWDNTTLGSSLIYGTSPSSSGNGDFTALFNNEGADGPSVLTDGSFGYIDFAQSGSHSSFTCIGSDSQAGNFVTYTLAGPMNGYDLTNIVVSAGWNDGGRDQQAYTVYYSTVANVTNFIPLKSVNFNPVNPDGTSLNKVTLTPATGALAQNVAAIKFDMTSPAGENGYSGYSEIAVYGSASAALVIAPSIGSATQSGGNLVVTGTGGYPPNSGYTWLTATNLSAPIIWTTNTTGVLDGTGAFSNSIPINSATPAGFFRLRIP